MNSIPERWAEQGRYDMDTAHDMLEAGRYRYVLFCCQQAVEKMLKSVFAARKNKTPPRIHNLMRLAEAADIVVSDEQAELLRELSAYYAQSRYPDEITDSSERIPDTLARDIFIQTQELLQWLESQVM